MKRNISLYEHSFFLWCTKAVIYIMELVITPASEITPAYFTSWPPCHTSVGHSRFTPRLEEVPAQRLDKQLNPITRMSNSSIQKASPLCLHLGFLLVLKCCTGMSTGLPVTIETEKTRQQANDLHNIRNKLNTVKNNTEFWFWKMLKWCLSFVSRPEKSQHLFAMLCMWILHELRHKQTWMYLQGFPKNIYKKAVACTHVCMCLVSFHNSYCHCVTHCIETYSVSPFLAEAPPCFHKCHVCWKTFHPCMQHIQQALFKI